MPFSKTSELVLAHFSLIEQKLLLLTPSSDVRQPARYLSQLYAAAKEYTTVVDKLFSSSNDTDVIFAALRQLRQISLTLSQYGRRFSVTYQRVLKQHVEKAAGVETRNASPEGDLAALHRRYRAVLMSRLQEAGCTDVVATQLIDDALDLLWELEAFVSRMEQLIETEDGDRARIASLVWQTAYPWEDMHYHLSYHLGSPNRIFSEELNPGVLGWSLIALWEIDRKQDNEKRQRGAP